MPGQPWPAVQHSWEQKGQSLCAGPAWSRPAPISCMGKETVREVNKYLSTRSIRPGKGLEGEVILCPFSIVVETRPAQREETGPRSCS